MEPTIRICCLLGACAIRLTQQSSAARVREVRDSSGFDLPLAVPDRHGVARRLTLRWCISRPLRRSTNPARPRGLTPHHWRRVMHAPAGGLSYSGDARKVAEPQGSRCSLRMTGGRVGGGLLAPSDAYRVRHGAVHCDLSVLSLDATARFVPPQSLVMRTQ